MRPQRRPGRARCAPAMLGAARSEPSVPSTREASRSKSRASSARDAEVPQGALRVGEGERERARGGAADRGTCGRARRPCRGRRPRRWRSRAGTTRPARGGGAGAGSRSDRARRPSCPTAAGRRAPAGRSAPRPRPRKRARSVSHSTGPCGRPSRLTTWKAHARGSCGARGRRWQSSAALSGRYSVSTNSLPNAGCAKSSRRRREDDLGVAGDARSRASAVAVIGHRQPADLDVVLGRDGDLELRLDVVVAPSRRSPGRREGRRGSRPAPSASAGRSADQTRRCGRRAGR